MTFKDAGLTFKRVQWVVVLVGIAVIDGVLLYKLLVTQQIEASPTEIIAAICIVSVLFVLSPNLGSLRELSLGKDGFKLQLEVLRRKTAENEDAIVHLILGSMGPEPYKVLTLLARGELKSFTKEPNQGLEMDLYHLRNLGYIKRTGATPSIREIPASGDDLSKYVYVTDAGMKYIEWRERDSAKE